MESISKKKLKRLLLLIILFIIINFFLFSLIPNSDNVFIFISDGFLSPSAMKGLILLVLLPLRGLLLALFLSFIPYKELKWSNKYLFFALLATLGFQVLMCFSSILKLVF